MAGRKYHGEGELFAFELFSSALRVEDQSGRELATEKLVVEPGRDALRQLGRMGDFDVFGNVFVLTSPENAEAIWSQTPARFEQDLAAGLGRLPNEAGLAYKILARETAPVAEMIRQFWRTVRQVVKNAPVMEAPSWK